MLFDLRSRGRRRTVQVVYVVLALLMGGGLVLFGVGTGQSGGGLLNAIGGGSSGAQSQVVSQQETAALKQIKLNPNNAQAWGNLLQARWTTARAGSGFGSATGYTAAGRRELGRVIQAWDRYVQLMPSPDPDLATLAARADVALGNFSGAASAWEAEAAATPSSPKGYECLAVTSYAAGDTRKGQLAATKALALLPKSQQATAKLTLSQAKSSTVVAKNVASQC
jgi:predicted Zn-dependent protease